MKRKRRQRKRLFIFIAIVLILGIASYFIVTKFFKNPHENNDKGSEPTIKEEEPNKNPSPEVEEPETENPTESETEEPTEEDPNLKYVDGILIVNKSFPLPADYVPKDTYKPVNGQDSCQYCVTNETYEHFKEMQADIEVLGLNIWIQSGYRSYNFQNGLYTNYVNRDGKEAADTYSARPGHSEHQTGLAFDLNTISTDFAYTPEGKWIHNNAYLYGFILRYPEGKESITGYMYEPWHLRYVGKDLAAKLYNNGDWITLEEYFDLPSTYEN